MSSITARKEAADAILRFLDGPSGEWDWDDFASCPDSDPFINSVRLLCLHLPQGYPPPEGSSWYCSEEGIALLRDLAQRLGG
jgi:hypothetical protein